MLNFFKNVFNKKVLLQGYKWLINRLASCLLAYCLFHIVIQARVLTKEILKGKVSELGPTNLEKGVKQSFFLMSNNTFSILRNLDISEKVKK